jgi:hypothetical protein
MELFEAFLIERNLGGVGSNLESELAMMHLSMRTGPVIRRSPSLWCGLAHTFRRTPHLSSDYFWGDDVLARFTACINLGRMSFSMIVLGGVESAL